MKRAWWLAAGVVLVVAAATLSMDRVFTTGAWRPEAMAALVLAVLLAGGAYRLRLPAIGSAALSTVLLVVFVQLVYVSDAGPLPTLGTLSDLRALLDEGIVQTRLQPAPAEPIDSLRLLVTGGTWIVAHLAHEALVRLRRPGLALLPVGLLWVVPLAVPRADVSPWPHTLPFLAAAAVVLLLEPNLDLTGWTAEDDRPRLSRTGLATTGVALAVAVVAPGILPGYGAEAWIDVSTAAEPRGYQPIVDVGDRLHLPEPRDVLLVESNRRLYLRLAALETFDGRTWRLGPPDVETYRPDPDELFRTNGRLPPETPIRDGVRVAASVRVLDLENIYVPVPYQVERIRGPEDAGLFYSREGGFVATGEVDDNELSGGVRPGVREGFEYELEAVVPEPRYDSLAELGDVSVAADDPRVQLPEEYADLRQLTEQIYADAGAGTTVAKAFAVQDYFIADGSPFTYSTAVPQLRGDNALQDFVFNSQEGYCEYFATAMAVMLRSTGVPARVAVGFLPGRVLPRQVGGELSPQFVVATTDAHAWVEVFFPEYGWIKFDPTPRGDGSTLPPTDADLDPNPPLEQETRPDVDAPSTEPIDADTAPVGPRPDRSTAAAGGDTEQGRSWPWLVVVGVAIAGFAVAVGRRTDQEDDPVAAVLASQRRVLRAAARFDAGRRPSETIIEVSRRWGASSRVDPDDAEEFALLAARAAFSGSVPAGAGQTVRALEVRLVDQLRGSLSRRDRVVAPVLDAGRRGWQVARGVASRVRERTTA